MCFRFNAKGYKKGKSPDETVRALLEIWRWQARSVDPDARLVSRRAAL
jgi:hypothetical protein